MLLQYANTKAPGGVDPLYLFRAQRMLQRKDIHVWRAATQIDMAGERLEIAFDTLYPGQVRLYTSLLWSHSAYRDTHTYTPTSHTRAASYLHQLLGDIQEALLAHVHQAGPGCGYEGS